MVQNITKALLKMIIVTPQEKNTNSSLTKQDTYTYIFSIASTGKFSGQIKADLKNNRIICVDRFVFLPSWHIYANLSEFCQPLVAHIASSWNDLLDVKVPIEI